MKRRGIAALLLIFALVMLAPVGGSHFAVRAEAAQAAAGTWEAKGGKWYYWEGPRYATGWREIDGEWYYFNASGVMQTGWVNASGTWYYMAASGKMRTGWVSVDGRWYYMSASGKMQTGWVSVGGYWYYMSASGKMQTGWTKVDGYWYYMSASGKMFTGWLNPSESRVEKFYNYDPDTGEYIPIDLPLYKDTKWYYMRPSGKMATGWESLGGKWYHFSSSGIMDTGWMKLSGKWYYLWDYMENVFYDYDDAGNNCDWYYCGAEYGVMTGEIASASGIYNKMIALKSSYPEGMRYTNDDMYEWEMGGLGEVYSYGYGCAGFVALVSDEAFGRVPVRWLGEGEWSFDSLRVGDILRVNGDRHSVIILEKYSDRVVVTEANYNSSVHWGRVFTKANVLSQTDYVLTRYPENYN